MGNGGKKRGKETRDGKAVRNTSMRPRREITARYIGFEKRERGTRARDRGNSFGFECSVRGERSRKLFTKFPDSGGTAPVKMQTPRLIPRLIGVCDYCGGELCRRAWRTLFSREASRTRARFVVDLVFPHGYIFFSAILAPRHIYAFACVRFFFFFFVSR